MSSITFVDYQTIIPASWLNDVNNMVYNGVVPATTLSPTNLSVSTNASIANITNNVVFTSTGAITLPNGTTAQEPGTPSAGMIRFNSTKTQFEGYNGSAWSSFGIVGGSNTQVQYNSSGALAGSSNLTFDGTTLTVNGLITGSAFSTYLASPPAIGGTTAAAGSFTTLSGSTSTTTPIVQSSGSLLLKTNGTTTAVTIDTNQNFGLGVTPETWSLGKAIEVGSNGNSLWGAGSGNVLLGSNFYYNSGYKYAASSVNASYYQQYQGSHFWNVATSGTAGGTISFTTAMTLDVNGNLGLGVTPSAVTNTYQTLQIGNLGNALTGYKSLPICRLDNNCYISGGVSTYAVSGYKASSIQQYNGSISFNISSDATQTAGSPIAFTTGMTLDNSGNLFLNGTGGAGNINWDPNGNATGCPYSIAFSSSNNSAYEYHSMYYTGASQYQFYVDWGGTVHARSIVITSLSDQRLKTNIKDISTGLSQILALQPRNFDWIDNSKTNATGFIAQEFQQIFPNSVTKFKAGEDGIEYLAMNHEELIPSMVKAIQELSAQVTALQAKVGA